MSECSIQCTFINDRVSMTKPFQTCFHPTINLQNDIGVGEVMSITI